MFKFIVRYLGFLKHVPGLPHVFDSMLRMWTLLTNRSLSNTLDHIEQEVLSWPRTSAGLHRFGGTQFDIDGKEIGHIHGNGILDILFSRDMKSALIREGLAYEHHVFPDSGWTSFYIRGRADEQPAILLLKKAYLIKVDKAGDETERSQ